MSLTCEFCGVPYDLRSGDKGRFCSLRCAGKGWQKAWSMDRLRDYSSPEPNTGCWFWLKSTDPAGYGYTHVKGKTFKAHRVAWWVSRGSWPEDGMLVCHRCDQPSCVNPEHLFLGTNADNMTDRDRKGRGIRGERHPFAKYPESLISALRSDSAGGLRNVDLCRKYGMPKTTVSGILSGKARASRLDAHSIAPSPSDASTGDVAPHSGIPGGEMSETKADLGDRGYWPEHCEQRAFVDGAKWWQFHKNGSTAFPSERDEMEAEAVRRFGEPARG